ncbi:carboxylesterase 1-like [Silene latifolia]|uniref:carboxylesterase 1-like n=1 Tax=Silene latifolia TaxID=37657 RepID=UPI003D783121
MSLPNAPELYEAIRVTPNLNGTVTRSAEYFSTVPPSTNDPTSPTLSKDVPVNTDKNTWVRIFLPRDILNTNEKLPILVYIHGGGFVVASPDFPPFHEFCSLAAHCLGAVVVSVKYRLAPENRLPAAYDDVLEALTWVKDGKDDWVNKYGDFSSCILMGESAGGNITYHVGLKAAVQSNDFKPLVIKGLVLIQPFFGGLDRTGSEIRLENDPILRLEICDFMWELSLPVGTDRDHEYCNPSRDGGSRLVDRVRDLGWWVIVVSCDGDPLFDRCVELAKLLENKVVNVRTMFSEGGQHGIYVMFAGGDSGERIEVLDFVKEVWP